ncbi:MAG: glycosyltransferase family 2 protein [Candidatus Falkowbacteria bacterium]
MKLSLITPTYNSAKTIARTIDSVVTQNYPDLEYIIVDGVSSDETAAIVRAYQDKIDIKFVSEKDSGIYDAMNKGIEMASGELIGILNSDDFFADDQVLKNVAREFADKNIDAVYGDIQYFSDDTNKISRYWRTGEYRESKINNGWIIPHPALFLRRAVYGQCGLFKTDFKIAGDYEFILRLLKIHKIKLKYLPHVFVKMYDGGASGANLAQRQIGWQELKKAWTVNGLTLPKLFVLRRVLFKLSQFLPSLIR